MYTKIGLEGPIVALKSGYEEWAFAAQEALRFHDDLSHTSMTSKMTIAISLFKLKI